MLETFARDVCVIPGGREAAGKGIQEGEHRPLDPLPLRYAPAGDDMRSLRAKVARVRRGEETSRSSC